MSRALLAAPLAIGLVLAACGSAAPTYGVTVTFNESVQQADMDETSAYLQTFDDDIDFLIRESFPPVGYAEVQTDAEDFCATVTAYLEAKPYVGSVSCEKQ